MLVTVEEYVEYALPVVAVPAFEVKVTAVPLLTACPSVEGDVRVHVARGFECAPDV
jgi:hypothetical protein